MKYITLGLLAATLAVTPALANDELVGLTTSELKQIAATQYAKPTSVSWKTLLFTRLDADKNNEISAVEMKQTGCKVNVKFFKYADADRTAELSRDEFFTNRNLFSRCK
jgi:hypothetical protein